MTVKAKKKINDKFTDVMGVDPVEDKEKDEAKALDMELWERKAIHDFKAKGRVYRSFQSDVIDDDEYDVINSALKAAQSIGEIKAAFKKRDAVDTLLDSVDDEARSWADEALA